MKEITIKKAMRGNRSALIELCEEVAKSVLFRVKHFLPNNNEAEDVAQEVLIRICERIHNLRDPKLLNAWISTIVLNEARRHMKEHSKRSKVLFLDDYLENQSGEADEESTELLPLNYTPTKEESSTVMELVDLLPDRQREAVLLHYYQEFNITETAEIMGIARQGASNYLKLAREKIREELSHAPLQADEARKTEGVASRALAALPVGPLLTAVITQEADEFVIAPELWSKKAQVAARVRRKPLAKFLVGIAASLTLVTTALAVLVVGDALPIQSMPALSEEQIPVIFSGGTLSREHINPRTATVEASEELGAITLLNWSISGEDSSTILYQGENIVVEEPFLLLQDGIYTITFTMTDEDGRIHRSYNNFQILRKAEG